MPACSKKSVLELIEDQALFECCASRLNTPVTDVIYPSRAFVLAFARLREAAGVQNASALAAFFGVRLSKISDVQRCEKIPVVWLYHLLLTRRVSPQWIIYGTGPKILELVDMVDESVAARLLEAMA